MKLKLTLLAVVPVEWTNSETKEHVRKFKHVFISENKNVHVAWSDTDLLKDRVSGTDDYDDARAREYEVQADEFEGKLKYRIILA